MSAQSVRKRRKSIYSSVKFCKNEFGPIFRYSARTRVIVEENSVRIVQRMKNPAARKAASSFELLAPSRTRNQNPNLLNHEGHEGKQEQARIKAYILKNAHLSAHLFILSRRSKPL